MLKSYRVGWWDGGPCDYGVSPSPSDLDFGTLDFGTSDSGLTISQSGVLRMKFRVTQNSFLLHGIYSTRQRKKIQARIWFGSI